MVRLSFLRSFTEFKVRLQRSLTYVALLNAAMLGFLFIDKLSSYGFTYPIKYTYPAVFVLTVIACDIIGRLDQHYGFHAEEIKIQMENNPQLNEVLQILKRMEENK